MPNICDNWVRITGPAETLGKLLTIPFEPRSWIPSPTMPTNDLKGYDFMDKWYTEHWGTKWVCNPGRDESPVMLQRVEGQENVLEGRFQSAWAPPIAFYRTIVREYLTGVTLEYEYHEWMMGFVGHGIVFVINTESEPHHFTYSSAREMRDISESREWHVEVWNPHFTGEDEDTSSLEEGWDDIRNYPEYTGETTIPRVPTPMPVFENLMEASAVPVPPKKVVKKPCANNVSSVLNP
jgi:hypothetical protein